MTRPRLEKVRPAALLVWGLILLWVVGFRPGLLQAQGGEVVITRLGLSQIRGTTLLTVILNQTAQPRITPIPDRRNPQLLIDFPQARTVEVPDHQPGDQELVQQVRLSALAGGKGVRIILDLVPDRPYVYWRLVRDNPAGGVAFLVGLRPDQRGRQGMAPGLAFERPDYGRDQTLTLGPPPTPPPREKYPGPAPGTLTEPTNPALAEIAQAVPQSGPALAFLEQQGWVVEQQNSSTRIGNRPGRFLRLSNSRYPELIVQVETLSAQAAGGPIICRLTLSTAGHESAEAKKYREMQSWNMATIKKHYEDIGDYYDDGLKPLRLILREQTKAIMLQHEGIIRQYLTAALPQLPQLPETVMKHVRENINKRLEGVQYTENADPLVILDLVDFYTLRVYFVGR